MQCDKCGSKHTQRLEVVYNEGISSSTSESISGGIGFNGGFGVGAMKTKGTGTSQSAISNMAAPPKARSFTEINILLCLGTIPALSMTLPGFLISGLFWIFCYVSRRNIARFNQAHRELYREWQESWLCRKCGNVYRQPISLTGIQESEPL